MPYMHLIPTVYLEGGGGSFSSLWPYVCQTFTHYSNFVIFLCTFLMKAQVHYSDYALSVCRYLLLFRLVIRNRFSGCKNSASFPKFVFFGRWEINWPPWPLVGWYISTSPLEQLNGIVSLQEEKLWRLVPSKICVFRADRNTKIAALTSDLPRHFRHLVCNRWTESRHCISQSESGRTYCFPIRIHTKLDKKQDVNVLYQVCVFPADRKQKMASLVSDWLRHFDFFSETAESNSTKIDRKQGLNVLYQVCLFRVDRKSKMAFPASDWLRHYRLLWNSTKLDRKKDLNVLHQVCVFRTDQYTKMAILSDPSKRWQIVLRCTICGGLGLLSFLDRVSVRPAMCHTTNVREKGRDLTQSYDKSPHTDRKIQKATWQHKKNATKTSITQRLRTDLGRSVGVTIATQLVWLNRFKGS